MYFVRLLVCWVSVWHLHCRFTVFALFPSVMSKIPKSGGWLNSVKVVLGFIMLAFSLKFLMTIDSVYSFKILSRDIYLAIWIVIFTLMGLYLMGKIKFRHDSDHSLYRYFQTFPYCSCIFICCISHTWIIWCAP